MIFKCVCRGIKTGEFTTLNPSKNGSTSCTTLKADDRICTWHVQFFIMIQIGTELNGVVIVTVYKHEYRNSS